MSVVVVATITPKPEHTDEVAAAFAEIIPQVHAEDGCELYALHRADDRLIMIERWASADALAVHSRGAALAVLNPKLRGKLTEGEITAQVSGRAKHLWSIFQKMKKTGRDLEQIYDVIAFRVITESVRDCYAVLGVVHSSWTPIPGSSTRSI